MPGCRAGEAYLYDAFIALVALATGRAVLPGPALAGGEVCEVAGFGPISTQAALDLLATQDPFLRVIVTDGEKVTGEAHLGRRPSAHQRSALDWLYPSCAAEGCSTRAERLQSDHRADWARAHITVVDLLDRLCPLHHGLKTRSGWALVEGRGKRAFVPPDDPRHPGPGRRQDGAGPGAIAGPGGGAIAGLRGGATATHSRSPRSAARDEQLGLTRGIGGTDRPVRGSRPP